jgi:hypothetical protein
LSAFPIAGEVGSVRSRPKHQIKTRSFGEHSEVSVARKERNASVEKLWAISASPRRALRLFASTLARNALARCQ